MLKVPLAIELGAVVFGALSGALHAVGRKADVVGTFSLAMSTGVGGGMLRDLLIGVSPPVALAHARYLPVVALAAVGAMLFAGALVRLKRSLAIVDALLLGFWTVMGTEQALGHHLPVVSAIFVGTVTAVGGGAVRDVLSGETPVVFLPGELYAIAAFVGAVAYATIVVAVGAAPRGRASLRRWRHGIHGARRGPALARHGAGAYRSARVVAPPPRTRASPLRPWLKDGGSMERSSQTGRFCSLASRHDRVCFRRKHRRAVDIVYPIHARAALGDRRGPEAGRGCAVFSSNVALYVGTSDGLVKRFCARP